MNALARPIAFLLALSLLAGRLWSIRAQPAQAVPPSRFGELARPLLQVTNLIPNTSFETAGGSRTDAASWSECSSHTRSSETVHSGSWALKSAFTGGGTDTRTSAITLAPNTSYIFSGWVYKVSTTGAANQHVLSNFVYGAQIGHLFEGTANAVALNLAADGGSDTLHVSGTGANGVKIVNAEGCGCSNGGAQPGGRRRQRQGLELRHHGDI